MSDLDLTALQLVLAEYSPKGRPALIPALHAAQAIYGYLPEPVAAELGRALNVPLAEVYGVIDFYAMFYRQPLGKTVVHVCDDPACALAGAGALYKMLSRRAVPPSNDNPPALTVERAPCLGLCEHAPALLVNETARGRVDPLREPPAIEALGEQPYGVVGGDSSYLIANCGKRRTTSLDEYLQGGGYQSLKKALAMSPAAVIAEVKSAGLLGRGGAAFPTGLKWEGAAQAAGQPKYVVCNADEAEPGTFKDRVLMEEDPQRLLEGLIIAAYAVGAHQGVIFIRGEYARAYEIMGQALDQARQAGLLGEDIQGSGFDFDVELFRSGRRQARLPPHQAAFPHHPRPLQPAHCHQQRRDPLQRAPHPLHGRRRLPRHRHPEILRPQALLPVRRRGPSWPLRSALWRPAAPPD
jgi:NADH-quinone oxidoreductase subunit F